MSTSNFRSLLPPNRQPLETALEQVLHHKYSTKTPDIISDVHDPQRCPAHLLPWLAYAESVDVWRDDWSEERKRAVIAASPEIHRIKGTPEAIHLALTALGQTYQLIEWWETPGEQPYCTATLRFDAETQRATGIDMRDVLEAVNRSKRLALHISTMQDDDADISAGAAVYASSVLTDGQTFHFDRTSEIREATSASLHGTLPPQPPPGTQLTSTPMAGMKLLWDNNHSPETGGKAFSVFGDFSGSVEEYLNRRYTVTLDSALTPALFRLATLTDRQPLPVLRATASLPEAGAAHALANVSTIKAAPTLKRFIRHASAVHFDGVLRRPPAALRVFGRELPAYTEDALSAQPAATLAGMTALASLRPPQRDCAAAPRAGVGLFGVCYQPTGAAYAATDY